ncbi:MAG: prevent-host-death protein [Gammaproteobacteria bacterium]|jgi:prevent-host-death family protein|nr:prevent-host-death protein [Gammaproteobacteria bacterium]
MNIEIGSYEAKTKLPELLRGVQLGHRYTITLRGEAIADLIPANASKKIEVVAGVAHMQQLMASPPPLLKVDTKILIEDGRD